MARGRSAVATALLLLAWGCGGDSVEGPSPKAPDTIRVTSPDLRPNGTIPARFTCDGDEVSPPLEWTHVPAGTKNLALVVEDPDAPDGTFVHWTVYDLPAAVRGLRAGTVPAGAREGENSFGDTGYGGPCPPEGDDPHRYVFYVYALDAPAGLDEGASPDEVRAAIGERALARGRLTVRYGR